MIDVQRYNLFANSIMRKAYKELTHWEMMFPHACTVQVPHAGHFVQEEAPDELADAAISFLKETVSARTRQD